MNHKNINVAGRCMASITITSQSSLRFKVMSTKHNSEGLEPPGSSVPAAMGLITSDQMLPHLQSPLGFTGFLATNQYTLNTS